MRAGKGPLLILALVVLSFAGASCVRNKNPNVSSESAVSSREKQTARIVQWAEQVPSPEALRAHYKDDLDSAKAQLTNGKTGFHAFLKPALARDKMLAEIVPTITILRSDVLKAPVKHYYTPETCAYLEAHPDRATLFQTFSEPQYTQSAFGYAHLLSYRTGLEALGLLREIFPENQYTLGLTLMNLTQPGEVPSGTDPHTDGKAAGEIRAVITFTGRGTRFWRGEEQEEQEEEVTRTGSFLFFATEAHPSLPPTLHAASLHTASRRITLVYNFKRVDRETEMKCLQEK